MWNCCCRLLQAGLATLRVERCLLDMMLMAGSGWEFGAHQGVLAAASGDFCTIFSRAPQEAQAEQVWLYGVEPECLAPLLNFEKGALKGI
ncbi:UNVERIFIED_CONTAM: hypothetical protein K2H54_050442 [Gekko kuhli]